jgi:hypothetical protein
LKARVNAVTRRASPMIEATLVVADEIEAIE